MYHIDLLTSSSWIPRGPPVDSSCCACLHPARTCLALARGSTLVISSLVPDSCKVDRPTIPLRHHLLEQDLTALAWFLHLAPPSSSPGSTAAAQQPFSPPSVATNDSKAPTPSSEAPSIVQELLDCQLLLTGTSDGFLQLHDVDGQLLFKQRLHDSAVRDIQVRPYTSGLGGQAPCEDITVTFRDAVVRISVLDLRAQVALLQLSRQASPPAATLRPLPFQRWELPQRHGPRSSGVCVGFLPPDLYGLLVAAGRNRQLPSRLCIVTGGQAPFLAAYEADEHSSRSTLGLLADYASSLTSGMLSAASSVAAAGPNLLKAGVRQYLLNPLLGSWAGAPQQQLPPVMYDDVKQLPAAESAAPWRAVGDDPRQADVVCPAPYGPLVAITDNMGRVLLADAAQMVLVRMWKGYRDAQCGWAAPPPGHPWEHYKVVLVLYAPKRQILEVWSPGDTKRIAAVNVVGPCVLLPAPAPCGGWQSSAAGVWRSQHPASTLVLQLGTGQAWDVLEGMVGGGA